MLWNVLEMRSRRLTAKVAGLNPRGNRTKLSPAVLLLRDGEFLCGDNDAARYSDAVRLITKPHVSEENDDVTIFCSKASSQKRDTRRTPAKIQMISFSLEMDFCFLI